MIGSWCQNPGWISLGFGKFARSDRIFALEPLVGEERGDGHRTRGLDRGIADPVIAARTEVTILRDMGQEAANDAPLLDAALEPSLAAGRRSRGGTGRPERSWTPSPPSPCRNHDARATLVINCAPVL